MKTSQNLILFLSLILFSLAVGRGIWSIPRKKSSSIPSSHKETSVRTDSDHLSQYQNAETLRSFLQESFDFAESYLLSDEFLSADLIQIFDTMYEKYSFVMPYTEKKDKNEDDSERDEGDDKVLEEIRSYLRTFPREILQEKAIEFIQNGRDASDEIVYLLQNPKKLLELVQTALTPEMLSPIRHLFSSHGLKELREFAAENFNLKSEEFDQFALPLSELFRDLETLLIDEERVVGEEKEKDGKGGAGGWDWLKSGEGQSEGGADVEDEMSLESVQSILQMFHDPKQVHFSPVLLLTSADRRIPSNDYSEPSNGEGNARCGRDDLSKKRSLR
jgi:hypothetical protein